MILYTEINEDCQLSIHAELVSGAGNTPAFAMLETSSSSSNAPARVTKNGTKKT